MDPIDNEMLSSDSSHDSDLSDDDYVVEWRERLRYKCKYCQRMFTRTQALVGHQNAHERENDLMRRQRELESRQRDLMLRRTSLANPVQYHQNQQLPNPYLVSRGLEIPRFRVCDMVNHYDFFIQCIKARKAILAGQQVDPSFGMMGQRWASTENPFQPSMVQPQLQPQPQPLPMNLDLCLGIGSTSQTQAWPKKPTTATKVAAEKEDDDPLALRL